LEDQVARFGVEGFEVHDFAVELAFVGAEDLAAFALLFVRVLINDGEEGRVG
jgi:hypothetical protein